MTFRALGLATLAIFALAPAARAQDGEAIFKSRCRMCHSVAPDGKPGAAAPNLRGVIGRRAASTSFDHYSRALTQSGIVWSREKLDVFLEGPSKLVPGTRMPVKIPDPVARAALLDYLASLSQSSPF